MPYIGAKELKASDIRRFDVTSSTSATHTLTWTPPTEQSLIVTINGIKQHEDAYSVSGTTLTLSSPLVATDKLEVIGINDIGTTITPAQNSVDTDKIVDDAVTAAKLNTTGTASASTFLRGDMAWATPTDQGKVLQVVSATYATQESTTSTTFVATSLSASITPSSTSNKILALLELPMANRTTANSVRYASGTLFRDATNLGNATYGMGILRTGIQNGDWDGANIGTCYLDSPSTTSSITYTAYYSTVDGDTAYAFINNAVGTLTLMEIAA